MGLVRRLPVDTTTADQAFAEGGEGAEIAAGALASLDLDAVRAQLRSGDADARRSAAVDLRECPEAVPDLLDCRRSEQDPAVREAILTALSCHDLPTVGLALSEDLRSEDPGERNAAVRALAAMPVAMAAAIEAGVLSDADADVRILAVMVLSTLPSDQVPAWLTDVVEGDDDQRVVAAAVDVAATLGGELAATLAPLASTRFPDDPFLAFLASTLSSITSPATSSTTSSTTTSAPAAP